MTTETIATRKRKLRQKLRQRRRSLGPREQAAAGRSLRDRLLCNSHFRHSRHIACYLPTDGVFSDHRSELARFTDIA